MISSINSWLCRLINTGIFLRGGQDVSFPSKFSLEPSRIFFLVVSISARPQLTYLSSPAPCFWRAPFVSQRRHLWFQRQGLVFVAILDVWCLGWWKFQRRSMGSNLGADALASQYSGSPFHLIFSVMAAFSEMRPVCCWQSSRVPASNESPRVVTWKQWNNHGSPYSKIRP